MFTEENMPDLNLSLSSQAMNSFLHDYDLAKATIVNTLISKEDDSYFCAETPKNNRSVTTH